ncbi:unnamed protein product [Cylindrotheca closterium]|uniref:DUF6824 domain-containing protein n=1 Tax=Cylindrotheca closterium TaxID=2856 RepID=A0AAD2CI20_9STRA|nr:unnamed protein product [Cylindrotheca closterium]
MQQTTTPIETTSPGYFFGSDAKLEPTTKDIIFGRGKKYQDHEGNKRMRDCVNEYKQLYNALKRFQKQALVETIYKKLVEGGARFLRKDEATDTWVLVKRELATQKVSHALRCKKHLGKSSPKNIIDLKKPAVSIRKDSNSTIESTVSTLGDLVSSVGSKENQMHAIDPASVVGRVTPAMDPILTTRPVAVKASLSTIGTNMAATPMPAAPVPSVATLHALQTLQMQDMLQRQRLLAMMDLQRQAQQQAASALYEAAISQILVQQHTMKQASE